MSAADLLRRVPVLGVRLRLDGDAVAIDGPARAVARVIVDVVAIEAEVTECLQLVAGAAVESGDEALLRAQLVALIREVAVLLGGAAGPELLAHTIFEPVHALPSNIDFFVETLSALRGAEAARRFITQCSLGTEA